jgi:hypothetical protein
VLPNLLAKFAKKKPLMEVGEAAHIQSIAAAANLMLKEPAGRHAAGKEPSSPHWGRSQSLHAKGISPKMQAMQNAQIHAKWRQADFPKGADIQVEPLQLGGLVNGSAR